MTTTTRRRMAIATALFFLAACTTNLRPLAPHEYLRLVAVLGDHALDEDVQRALHLVRDVLRSPLVIVDVLPDLRAQVTQEVLVRGRHGLVVHRHRAVDHLRREGGRK